MASPSGVVVDPQQDVLSVASMTSKGLFTLGFRSGFEQCEFQCGSNAHQV